MWSILDRKLYILFCLLAMSALCFSHNVRAQEFIHFRGVMMPWLSQNSRLTYPNINIPNTTTFENSNTPFERKIGIDAGFSIIAPITLSLAADAVYSTIESIGNESTTFSLNGQPQNAIIRHDISTQYIGLQFTPTLSTKFHNFKIAVGFPYCLPLTAHSTHEQNVSSPPELRGTLLTDAVTQYNIISQFTPYFGIQTSVFYSLPLNSQHTFWLMPGISAQQALSSITKADAVRPLALGFTLGLQYSPSPQNESSEIPDKLPLDTVQNQENIFVKSKTTPSDTTVKLLFEKQENSSEAASVEPQDKAILTGDIHATFLSDKVKNDNKIILNRVFEYCNVEAIIPYDQYDTLSAFLDNHKRITKEKTDIGIKLSYNDTIDVVYPSILRIYHRALAESGLSEWKVIIRQQNTTVKVITGTNLLPEYTDIDINAIEYFDNTKKSFSISLELTDSDMQTFHSQEVVVTFTFSSANTKPIARRKIHVIHPRISAHYIQKNNLRTKSGSLQTIESRDFLTTYSTVKKKQDFWYLYFCSLSYFENYIFAQEL